MPRDLGVGSIWGGVGTDRELGSCCRVLGV